jgi:hypothetical protein
MTTSPSPPAYRTRTDFSRHHTLPLELDGTPAVHLSVADLLP